MNKKYILTLIFLIILLGGFFIFKNYKKPEIKEESINQNLSEINKKKNEDNTQKNQGSTPAVRQRSHPMSIENLRNNQYQSDDFIIEKKLINGSNYEQFIASYRSEGLKINGLLTVPLAQKPNEGFPAIIFIHGYIPPKQYSTTKSYPTYQAALARANFVTFKPDLRGHDESEGEPVSAHFSEKYVIDTLNSIEHLKKFKEVNPARMGYWGHSNGGEIGLRTVLASQDIKAASFWAGVVGSYEDMFETYINDIPFLKDRENPLIDKYGLPSKNKEFYQAIDPYYHLKDINIPIQLQHGTNDKSVPVELSRSLKKALEKEEKTVELIEYPGDDHNIGINSALAWQRTIKFFRDNL